MTTRKIFTAVFERDSGGDWIVELAEEPRVHSFGKTLEKARANIADAAGLWFRTEPSKLTINEDIRLPKVIWRSIERAQRERAEAEHAQHSATVSTTQAARALVEQAHLSLRDASAILHISHQRVQQLLAK